jgi:putative adenylate-forming enzyme
MFDKYRVLSSYLRAKVHRRITPRPLLVRGRERMIRKHLAHVISRSPFYADHFSGYSLNDWRGLPTIDKKTMMENFSELNTADIKVEDAMEVALQAERDRDFSPMLGDITVGLSSGTSGNKGLFLANGTERLAWAGTILARVLSGSLFDKHRVAFFLRANSNLYQTVGSGKITFNFFDLIRPIGEHLPALEFLSPTILVAPPSVLRLLALKLEAEHTSISPKKIVSVAEVLDPLDRAVIERGFGQMVHEVYQATEGFIAATCEHGTLHLNEDILTVEKEYLSPRRYTPIITDFTRITQPVIRYRLDDVLVERATPCPCGSAFEAIEKIEGRCDDLLSFRSTSGDAEITIFPDFISRALITASEKIIEYCVAQTSTDNMDVYLALAPGSCRKSAERLVLNSLEELCNKSSSIMPEIDFRGPPEEVTPGIKQKRIKRIT